MLRSVCHCVSGFSWLWSSPMLRSIRHCVLGFSWLWSCVSECLCPRVLDSCTLASCHLLKVLQVSVVVPPLFDALSRGPLVSPASPPLGGRVQEGGPYVESITDSSCPMLPDYLAACPCRFIFPPPVRQMCGFAPGQPYSSVASFWLKLIPYF